MNLLILGGAVFLGRHLVEAAQARGHTVTLFNRGQHNPEIFPAVEKLRGDRDGDLTALKGRCWDAVIDTCGYGPRQSGTAGEMAKLDDRRQTKRIANWFVYRRSSVVEKGILQ